MMDEFMKMLAKKAKEQGGLKEDSKIKAKASMAKELSDMLGSDISEGIKDGMKSKEVVKAGFTSDKEHAPEAAEKLKEAVDAKFSKKKHSEDEDSEIEEGEGDMPEEEMRKHESMESEDADELESEIAELERELEEKKRKLKHKS